MGVGLERCTECLHESLLFHTEKATAADDDVVEDVDTDDVTGLLEASCDVDVVSAGRGISRRMIVGEDDACRSVFDGELEDLAGVDDAG